MHNNSREKLREIYQREDNSQKTFIPAKPKVESLNTEPCKCQ